MANNTTNLDDRLAKLEALVAPLAKSGKLEAILDKIPMSQELKMAIIAYVGIMLSLIGILAPFGWKTVLVVALAIAAFIFSGWAKAVIENIKNSEINKLKRELGELKSQLVDRDAEIIGLKVELAQLRASHNPPT